MSVCPGETAEAGKETSTLFCLVTEPLYISTKVYFHNNRCPDERKTNSPSSFSLHCPDRDVGKVLKYDSVFSFENSLFIVNKSSLRELLEFIVWIFKIHFIYSKTNPLWDLFFLKYFCLITEIWNLYWCPEFTLYFIRLLVSDLLKIYISMSSLACFYSAF